MKKNGGSAKRLQQEIKRLQGKPSSIRAAVRSEEVFSLLAEHIAIIQQSATYIEQLGLLREIANKLVEVRDLGELARHILEGANKLIPFTDGSLGLVDQGIITFQYAIGRSAESVMSFKIAVGEGLTGWVVKNRQPVNIGDTSKDERYRDQIKQTKSELDVPIIYGSEGIGVINIESNYTNAFSVDDQRLLTTLAGHAAIALKNAQLFNQIEARARIIARLTSSLEYADVLELVLETVFGLIKCTEASVGIVYTETNEIRFTIAKGPSKKEVEEYVMSINKGLNGWVVRNNKAVRVGDVTKDPRYEPQITSTKSELDVPMVFADKVIGVLNVESPNADAFSNDDQELLESLAPYAALALRNAGIYQDVKRELEAERELHIAAETMAAIGDVAGNLVHHMNNDVGAIRVRSQQIGKIADNALTLDKAKAIEKLSEKVLSEVRSFRERFKDVEPTPLDVNEIIRAAIREVSIPHKITVIEDLNDNLTKFSAAEVHLKEVFRNLVANAVEAMPKGGKLWISSQQLVGNIIVRVKDSGIGISDENQPLVFNQGFSTKEEGRGLGYGLWWVKKYLNRNGCNIEIEKTKLGVGSTFVVTLLAKN